MANLISTLKLIKPISVSNIMFNGIDRKYFPKWEGWDIVDSGNIPSDVCVDNFYNVFFWSKIRGDSINSQSVANLLMAFSIISGKKKAISKLQRVLGTDITGIVSNKDIITLNSENEKIVFLSLFAEFVEFYVNIRTPDKINSLLNVYYKYISL